MELSDAHLCLREFVREIRQYYLLNKQALNGIFEMPAAMVRFRLRHLDDDAFEALIARLKNEGHITNSDESKLTFSEGFYE